MSQALEKVGVPWWLDRGEGHKSAVSVVHDKTGGSTAWNWSINQCEGISQLIYLTCFSSTILGVANFLVTTCICSWQ